MAVCEDIIKLNIEPDCSDPVVRGIEPNGVIINRDDIDFSGTVFNTTRKNIIEELVLKTSKKGYKIYVPSPTPFNNTQTTLEVGANRSSFTNDLAFVVLSNDPDVSEKIIDGLANGTFVVIFENKYKNLNKPTTPGDSTFQIMGYYQGLKATTLENNKYSDETDGGWNVVLQETKVPKSALFFFDTDISTTQQKINTLLV